MTGRGIDQILPHPCDPALQESYVHDARDYVRLAEKAGGPIPKPVGFDYVWGDALAEWRRAGSDLRIINLETAITAGGKPWPDKGIHYRMNPKNIGCLRAADVACCCLANNHVIDWGYAGLSDTLRTLVEAGLAHAGAGTTSAAAAAPAVLELPGKGHVLVFSMGSTTSGIPPKWAAIEGEPGVNLLKDLSEQTAHDVAIRMRGLTQPGDIVIASIHWGENWGYEIPDEQVRFAHRLIDEGVHVVFGQSSHHPKAIEIYKGRLILYGCGDFIDDYEGISGHEEFRPDLRLMYQVRLHPDDGSLVDIRLVPFQSKRLRLVRASSADAKWICDRLDQQGARFGTRVQLQSDQSLTARRRSDG